VASGITSEESLVSNLRLLVSLLVFLTTSYVAEACGCPSLPESYRDDLDRPSVQDAFYGNVLSVELVDGEERLGWPVEVFSVRFEVAAVWKGDAAPIVELWTPRDSGACGWEHFPPAGSSLVVFSNGTPEHGYRISLCSASG